MNLAQTQILIKGSPNVKKKDGKKGDVVHTWGVGGSSLVHLLAQIYKVPKTLGYGLCTLDIYSSDHQLS